MKTFLVVKNFERFQHYRDRAPLWIKLYNALLDDYGFQHLSEKLQLHLVLIWLLASRHDNRIPDDAAWIRKAIHAHSKVDIEALVRAGWLLRVEHGASNLLAEPEQNATAPRARGEERREEIDTSTSLPGIAAEEQAVAERLSSDAGRVALTTIIATVDDPNTWLLEMSASLSGMPGHAPLSPTELDQALRDYVGNAAVKRKNFRQFRRYLQQASERAPPGDNGAKRQRKKPKPQEYDYTPTRSESDIRWQR